MEGLKVMLGGRKVFSDMEVGACVRERLWGAGVRLLRSQAACILYFT